MLKRVFDFTCSFLGLLLLLPLFLCVALWIKLDSGGKVFYRQLRVGRYNSDFFLYKFRTMADGSDKKGLITVGNDDSRITRAGGFLRKYKIDELPQLINVLKGDMSLVGPRPEVRKYVARYSSQQMKVLDARPGITDVASIKFRNENEILKHQENPEQYYLDSVMPEKLDLNLKYLAGRSFFGDIKIIFNTFFKVLK